MLHKRACLNCQTEISVLAPRKRVFCKDSCKSTFYIKRKMARVINEVLAKKGSKVRINEEYQYGGESQERSDYEPTIQI
jgi:hypothetical protein